MRALALAVTALLGLWFSHEGLMKSVGWAQEAEGHLYSNDRWERRDPFYPLRDAHAAPVLKLESIGVTMADYRYRTEGRRDPFLSVFDQRAVPTGEEVLLTPLERFEASVLKFVGVIWDHRGYRAMLETPDGMAYTARLGTAVGLNGVVANIDHEQLIVREAFTDRFGETKAREVVLTLYPEEGTEKVTGASSTAQDASAGIVSGVPGGGGGIATQPSESQEAVNRMGSE